jgi:hypothetical protein
VTAQLVQAAATPHLTLCYTASQQPAAPIIAALGKSLPARKVTIGTVSLVIQHGPALSWDWRPVGTAHIAASRKANLRARTGYAATVTTATWLVAGGTDSPASRRPSI